ncbi:beta-1,6-N-acetylglucosaminyltransferase, contains WSC domain [Ceraceosorus bombacis]|uniref:Beta-1,6-N-acetylglucosaminyltransferase, contains WSC domain n=1 Tax=Ceraceosorus bombacis TaxID=401625 RepID=A0A0P1BBQ0_9BASI|nr:beta-1,6-N-acetylglucosaminyltransferase, contains WSC domain [Ceraceosorus bombacis]
MRSTSLIVGALAFAIGAVSAVPAPQTGTSPAAGPSAPFQPSGPDAASWQTTGCTADFYPNSRLLRSGYTEDKQAMTVGKCLTYCGSLGAYYAGLEYGYQCFCGDALNSPTGTVDTPAAQLTSSNDGGCNTVAPGNGAQRAGGPNKLLVFQSKVNGPAARSVTITNGSYQGCYRDDPNNRLLPAGTYGINDNTVQGCATRCANSGYDLSATEYRSECHCGSSSSVGPPANKKIDESNCNNSCTGNTKQICGDASALSVYKTTLSTTPPTGTPQQPSPVTARNGQKYNFIGCYKDRADPNRALDGAALFSNARTIQGCITTMADRGFKYAALENGNECRGGNTLLYSSTVGATCDKPCSGNSAQTCGGSVYSMSLYQVAA